MCISLVFSSRMIKAAVLCHWYCYSTFCQLHIKKYFKKIYTCINDTSIYLYNNKYYLNESATKEVFGTWYLCLNTFFYAQLKSADFAQFELQSPTLMQCTGTLTLHFFHYI